MASTAASGRTRTRRPMHPGRKRLALAVAMVMFGSFLPWIHTAIGNLSGSRGPGLWTFYVAMLGLAGALLPFRRVAAVQGAIMAAVAIAIPVWQIARILGLVGFGGWMPGPGIVVVFGGGVLAAVAAVQLLRVPDPAP